MLCSCALRSSDATRYYAVEMPEEGGPQPQDMGAALAPAEDAPAQLAPVLVPPSPELPAEPAAPEMPDPAAPSAPPALCELAHWPGLGDLNLTQRTQSIALRVRGQSHEQLGVVQLASLGGCMSPDDPVECEIEMVNAADSMPYETTMCDPVCKQYFLVTSFNGAVSTWGNANAVRELLGAIDTRGEAILHAFYNVPDIDLSCAAADPRLVVAARGGYDVPVRVRPHGACGAATLRGSVFVEFGGKVTLRGSDEAVGESDACP